MRTLIKSINQAKFLEPKNIPRRDSVKPQIAHLLAELREEAFMTSYHAVNVAASYDQMLPTAKWLLYNPLFCLLRYKLPQLRNTCYPKDTVLKLLNKKEFTVLHPSPLFIRTWCILNCYEIESLPFFTPHGRHRTSVCQRSF
jgi:hypothetical protein